MTGFPIMIAGLISIRSVVIAILLANHIAPAPAAQPWHHGCVRPSSSQRLSSTFVRGAPPADSCGSKAKGGPPFPKGLLGCANLARQGCTTSHASNSGIPLTGTEAVDSVGV